MSEFKPFEFETVMRNENFIVRDHRVHHVRIMPGVTFLDMIWRLLKREGYPIERLALRNIVFKEAVSTTEAYDKRIRIVMANELGRAVIRCKSLKVKEGRPLDQEWDDNFQCELAQVQRPLAGRMNVAAMKAQAERVMDIEEMYATAREVQIHHYEFMKTHGKVYITPTDFLAEVNLSELAKQYLPSFFVHPAILDTATFIPFLLHNYGPDPKPYIPLFIEAFQAIGSLVGTCYIHAPRNLYLEKNLARDVNFSDLGLYDSQGELVAVFKKLTEKQIRGEGLIKRLTTVDGQEVAEPQAPAAAAPAVAPVAAAVAAQVPLAGNKRERMALLLCELIGPLLSVATDQVDRDEGFYEQGLESTDLLKVVSELESRLKLSLYPTLLFEYTTVNELAGFLEEEVDDAVLAAPLAAAPVTPAAAPAAPTSPAAPVGDKRGAMVHLLRSLIAPLLGVAVDQVDGDEGFYEQGLESTDLLKVVSELESRLQLSLYPTLLFEYTTINELAGYLADEVSDGAIASLTGAVPAPTPVAAAPVQADTRPVGQQIVALLQQMVASPAGMDAAQVPTSEGFYEMGLESTDLLELVRALEDRIGESLYPTLLFEYTTVEELAGFLEENYASAFAGAAAPVTPVSAPVATQSAPTQAAAPAPSEVVRAQQVWEGSLLEAHSVNERIGKAKSVLIFEREDTHFNGLKERFAEQGMDVPCYRVKAGRSYRREGDCFVVRPNEAEDFETMIGELAEQNQLPDYVALLWTKEDASYNATAFRNQVNSAPITWQLLTQALMQHKPRQPVRLLHAYRRPDGQVLPVIEGLTGFARSLRLENPKFHYRMVAVDDAELDMEQILIDEWCAQDAPEAVLYNDQGRHVRALELLPAEADDASRLRQGGVYLITGGLGGLGLIFAEYLAKHYKAKLVLTGRSEPNQAKQQQMDQLRELGAEVLFVASDISQNREVDALADQVHETYGALHGVIHAAGVLRDSMLMRKSLEDLEAVMAAKVYGTVALANLLQRFELDFMALFSSTTAVSGTAGQTDYAYANTFMDAFAEAHAQDKTRVVAVNWPLWRDGGMQVDDGVLVALEKQEGMRPMAVETGMQAFEHALQLDSANYIVIEGIARRICEVFGLPVPVTQDVEAASEALVEAAAAPTVSYDMGAYQAPTVTAQVAHSDLAGPAVEDVAIIGVAGRYPKAEDVRAFWENLKAGIDCIEEVPAERWHHGAFFNEDKQSEGTAYSKWGGFIDKVDKFDPLFFNIAPKEAELMEPQERLFLQTAWHTLEDAGYARSQLGSDNVGVYVGVMWGQYQLLGLEGNLRGETAIPHPLYATIANRVSYCLNLRGPSMALDTMCSSSLTTIHLACQAIQKGECDLALAGGVNLTLHPVKYTYLSQEKMLSTDGRCRSFGEGGDGYVPGEGVGAVLLKPLSKALADGDFIYATIKGSTLNHGGKTSGYSVPDPNAQARLVQSAFRNAGVSPVQFSYLETHGTGTALGDPIEITGMGKAFKDAGMKPGSLAIGSVKSNIGHLESAAGIAGVTKILLQMQHRQLVPSLHSAELNEKIPFERTPFHVQQQLSAWEPPRDAAGQPRKRLAGISSFGAGGSNAHIVFEEAPPVAPVVSSDPQVVLLSAKQSECLQAYAQRWLDFIDAGQLSEQDLVRVAWTTQVGREPMTHRAAIVARNLAELRRGLMRIIELGAGQDGVAIGKAKKGVPAAAVTGKDAKALLTLAKAWVDGAAVDWTQLHNVRPQRMPLPLYPFAEEGYWLPGAQKPQPRLIGGSSAALHPLLTHNISTYYRMRFVTELGADASVFSEHQVNGRGLLPGVVYLEMARAAAAIALEEDVRHLAQIAFEAPVWAPQDGTVKLFIDLEPLGQQGLQVVVRSGDTDSGIVHFQCQALLDVNVAEPNGADAVFANASSEMSQEQAYAAMASEGFLYAGSFRSMQHLHVGDAEVGVALALADGASLADYGLHPGLLDGLLQSVIGLDEVNGGAPEHVPYQIGDLYFLRPMTAQMRGVLQAKFDPKAEPQLKPYDGVLYDDQGRVAVVLHDSVMRMPARASKASLEVFEPVWRDAALAEADASSKFALISDQPELAETYLGFTAEQINRFFFAVNYPELVDWPSFFERYHNDQDLELLIFQVRFTQNFQRLLEVLLYNYEHAQKAKLAKMPKLVVVVGSDPEVADGVAGMLRSLQLESSRFNATVLAVEDGLSNEAIARTVLAEAHATDMAVRLHEGKRQVREWQPVDVAAEVTGFGLEAGQTVLITGGLGGLGWLYAQHLAENEQVNVALLNRSPLNDARREQIKTLEALGVKVLYLAADISDAEATSKAVAQVREQLGGLHGVIHAAGVLRDGLAIRKSVEDLAAVLAPKVNGTLNLDAALADVSELRFWLLCSSVAAVGSEGQSDYAAGNGFMNGFAEVREARRKAGKVAGRTLSIGWPLWRDGGMSVGERDLKELEREWGMLPLATADGIAITQRLLASELPCADVIYGYKARMQRRYQSAVAYQVSATPVVAEVSADLNDQGVQDRLHQLLAELIAGEIKLDPKRIDLEAELEDYGIDSVMIVNLTEKLSQHFGTLSKTLLFEYTRLVDLAGYFLREHASKLRELFAPTVSSTASKAGKDVRHALRQRLLEVLAGETKLRVDQIDIEEELENYGIDSVMTINLTDRLSQVLGLALSKTLLYEFTTLAALENYFVERHADVLQKLFAKVETAKKAATKAIVKEVVKQASLPESRFANKGNAYIANEPIAIVGMAGRFPMADDLEAFWQNLQAGLDCISHVPAARWDRHASYFGAKDRFQQWGGFMDGIELFDPYFFNMTPREAAMTDPQERLFLETVYHVLEDAGYAKRALSRKAVGVFVGVMWGEYNWFGMNGGATPDAMYASIANRVSYWFDFKGPSMALDTMCSSSLTAIHLACRSLREGESEYAIAGGVNVSAHPYKYKILAERNFPSSDGRCRAFGAGGDGYVPGEGVGALMLKRLSQAQADGDHIYAVLRATALNHGGKSNGYTVPNPAAQYEVINKALEQAQVDPRTVGYIEAHGTGTALGDPIEIAGLKRAFAESGAEPSAVAIGSVKSNVGHCESAAGVAGIIKVLLQMQHRKLVPSLHAETLNPDLDIEGSAFRVQRELQDWSNQDGQPLRAGLSSFGAGGSNAHFVIEGYPASESSWQTPDTPWFFVLSAQNEDRLREYADRFIKFLADQEDGNLYAGDLVYTLMVGRELMDARLVILFRELAELASGLRSFVAGETTDTVFAAHVRQANSNAFFRSSGRARDQIVRVLLQEQDWSGLAELAAQGFELDWQMLYGDLVARRVPLPKYPFERLRCWVPDENLPQPDGALRSAQVGVALHPLITHNLSSLYQMRFVANLDANAFYFTDHIIDGKKLLPGAVYLEMARAAAALAFEAEAVEVVDLVWQAPLVAEDQIVKVLIDVVSESDREVTVSLASEDGLGEHVHATCRVMLAQQPIAAASFDPQAFEAAATHWSAAQLYDALANDGFVYGPRLRSLQSAARDGDRLHVVVELPSQAPSLEAGFVLHPVLIDGMLQSLVVFDQDDADASAFMPYGLGRVIVSKPLSKKLDLVIVRRHIDHDHKLYDAKVYDDSGALCLSLQGITLKRQLRKSAYQMNYFESVWQSEAAAPMSAETQGRVLVLSQNKELIASLRQRFAGELLVSQPNSSDGLRLPDFTRSSLGELYEQLKVTQKYPRYVVWDWSQIASEGEAEQALTLLHGFQAWQAHAGSQAVKLVLLSQGDQTVAAGLAAMLRSLHLESPRFLAAIVHCEDTLSPRATADAVLAEFSARDMEIALRNGERLVRSWQPLALEQSAQDLPVARGDVIMITGGLGGLGWLFAQHLAEVYGANLVLVNRSPLQAERQAMLEQLRKLGVQVTYHACDITDEAQVRKAVAEVREEFGRIDGVIHAAGVLRDGLALRRRDADLLTVLAPKVMGTQNLDAALADQTSLKFFALFASVSAAGSDGQCDYAFANNFQNAFATKREQRRKQGACHGVTLSLGWPFWASGGMQVDAQVLDGMYREWGMKPLETEQGIAAFATLLQSGVSQPLVIYGDGKRAERRLRQAQQHAPFPQESRVSAARPARDEDVLRKGLRGLLLKILSEEIQLDPSRINPDEDLEDYGIDSVMVLNLTEAMSQHFGELSKTLLFEYRSLSELEAYFIEAHAQQLQDMFGQQASASAADVKETQVAPPVAVSKPARLLRAAKSSPVSREPIAIVGMSGRFPMAEDLDAFWANLQQGLDCISEVPAARWDKHAAYYGSDKPLQPFGGFLDGVDQFDPYFFNMTPREAALTDPQERLFLETVHQTVEDAGYAKSALAGKAVGVYVGVMWGEYAWFGLQGGVTPGALHAAIANRVSYWFDFKGPSVGLDTMCSSSLTAIHFACQALREGKLEVGIAGGVNVSTHPYKYKLLADMNFPSTDGRCRAFGAGGDGYVPSEGVGAVMLKRLSQAEADGDHIYAVLRATELNHGGKTNGFTVPNPVAQAEVVAASLRESGVDPATISYIEAHGTGTALGDPIEITGLKRAFKDAKLAPGSVAIGSVKSNIGHCESTAGMAGLIKVLLQMQHRQLVPSLHAETLNPDLGISGSPFKVQRECSPWQKVGQAPLRAGLSSFGAGGSNAHFVIEAYESEQARQLVKPDRPWLFLLSAQNEARLQAYVERFVAFLQVDNAVAELPDLTPLLAPVTQALLAGFGNVLNVAADALDAHENPVDWGFDAIQQQSLITQLEKSLGVSVPAKLWLAESVAAMADVWCGANATELARVFKLELKADQNSSATTKVRDDLYEGDLVFTLMQGREPMPERLGLVFDSFEDLLQQLQQYLKDGAKNRVFRANVRKTNAAAFLSGNERAKQQFIDALLAESDWPRVAELWVLGVGLDWQTLYGEVPARRVSLPSYPFERGSYWLPETKQPLGVAASAVTAKPEYVVLNKQWRQINAPESHDLGTQRLLIMATAETETIARKLFAADKQMDCRVLLAGRDFSMDEAGATVTSNWRTLWSELPTALIDLTDLDRKLALDGLAKLRLWQDVLAEFRVQPFSLLHLTRQRVAVGEGALDLHGAVSAAMTRVLSAEVRILHARTIDVDRLDGGLLERVIAVELQRRTADPEVIYRDGKAFTATLMPRHRSQQMDAQKPALNVNKAIWITGGTRGIGAALAVHMVNLGAKRLVLLGRSDLPARSEWDTWCSKYPNDQTSQKIRLVRDLEQHGAKVEVHGVDLSDVEALGQLKTESQMGDVGTLIHCAGLPSDDPPSFVKKSLDDMARVLQPKVSGLTALYEAFGNDNLDAMILVSSMSAQLPQIASGAADYAAANAFMDDFASYARQQGVNAYSIQFPNWIETGMGEVKSAAAERFGIQGVRTQEGLHLFDLCLHYGDAVSLPLKMLTQQVASFDALLHGVINVPETSASVAPATETGAPATGGNPAEVASNWLRDLLVRELRFEATRLQPDTEFGDIGVDSVMIAELVTFVEDWLGTQFDPSLFLEYPTLRSLGEHIAEHFSEALAQHVDAAPATTPQTAAPVKAPSVPAMPVTPPAPTPQIKVTTPAPISMQPQSGAHPRFAIVGVGCNLPGGPDPEPFWQMLIQGKHAVREIPELRWHWPELYHPEYQKGRSISKWGAFLDGIDYFDPEFFKLSPGEATSLDPLVRQVLESSAKAVNHAGYQQKELSGKRVGVFVGSRIANWNDRLQGLEKNTIAATEQNFIAAHVSHYMNLKGPNLVLDCACSSSLMSIHLACQSILNGDSEMALAGGSDILLDERPYLALSEGRALSPDGRCFTFDENANGFVPGEGCGMLLIKSLDRAMHDGDQIYAVIESSATNNDGRTMGITTPNPEMQVDVIQHALAKANMSADQVSYMECHGTGTKIGDPIELKALTRVFRQYTQENSFCAVGSVKTNIGHLLSAAGVAGVIKLVLALQNQQLPPTLNCSKPNPRFEFETSPFYPNLQAQTWQPRFGKRVAGISGFGFGGTNVHVLLSDGDPGLLSQYQAQRQPLPDLVFNKRRFWLEKVAQSVAYSRKPDGDAAADAFKPFAEFDFV